MEEYKVKNPWLGLESYQEGEILYGRDDDIRDLSQCVLRDNVTLLYGRSGIGKSSLLNAGIIPTVRRNGYCPVKVRLIHKNAKPYLEQIKDAIASSGIVAEEKLPVKDKDNESLYEYFHRHIFTDNSGARIKVLIVFDQFEEMFTLQDSETVKKKFFRSMADFINDIMPDELQQKTSDGAKEKHVVDFSDSSNISSLFGNISLKINDDVPEYINDNVIHLVFTIREDFLSDFEYYTSAIPALKQNRFGLRPLNEEQAAQIITRPVPGLVSLPVAKLIIEKVTGRTDFKLDGIPEIEVDSAVLSLYMNRLFEAKTGKTITADLVEQKGGVIISDFYADAIKGISESTVEYLEDHLLNGQGRRDNITVYDAETEGHVSKEELDVLCNKKKILRQFNYAGDLRLEYVHDILCSVVKEHKDERRMVRQQEAERQRQEAERRKMEEEHEKLLLQQQREHRKYRRIMVWGSSLLLLVVAILLFNGYWNNWEYSEYYASFTRQNGWPVGVGERLDKEDALKLTTSYQLVRNGRSSSRPFSEVRVCSSTKEVYHPDFRSPLAGNNEKNDARAAEFAHTNMQVRVIRFTAENSDADAAVSRELYLDKSGKLLYAVNYYTVIENQADSLSKSNTVWAVYLDSEGLPMKIRSNGADRMKIMLSSSADKAKNRLEVKYLFYDEHGSPQSNDVGCYGFRVVYNDDRTIDTLYHLNPFGIETLAEVRAYKGNETVSSFTNIFTGIQANGSNTLKYPRIVFVRDAKGNITEIRRCNKDGKLAQGSNVVERRFYDRYNRVDSTASLDNHLRLTAYSKYKFNGFDVDASETYAYDVDRNGNRTLAEASISRQKGNTKDIISYSLASGRYFHERIITKNNTTEHSYLDRSGSLVFDSVAMCCRYIESKKTLAGGFALVKKYYGLDGRLYTNPNNPRVAAVDSSYYDNDALLRSQVSFDAFGNVITSMGYDYKDRQEVARYALSLDGKTPIRCPQWEVDGLCYYKLYNVKNSQEGFNLAYVQTESEYPSCRSYLYFGNANIESYPFTPVRTSIGEGWVRQESVTIMFPSRPNGHEVTYLHITDLHGGAYKAGLRDGDLVLTDKKTSSGQLLTVVRYNRNTGRWQRLSGVHVPFAGGGMETYPVIYTDEEYAQYLKNAKI